MYTLYLVVNSYCTIAAMFMAWSTHDQEHIISNVVIMVTVRFMITQLRPIISYTASTYTGCLLHLHIANNGLGTRLQITTLP